MEPLSVIAILTFIKDVVEQVRLLKATIDKVSSNDKECRRLVNEILKLLETLQENCDPKRLKENIQTEKLRRDVLAYIKNLELSITKCNKLVVPDRFGDKVRAWWDGEKIASELQAIQTDLSSWNQRFITAGLMRTEKTVSDGSAEIAEIKDTVNRVEAKIEKFISQAALRPDKARSLIRLDRIDPRNMKESLHRASKALRHNSYSTLQKRYLHLKIQTLQQALDNPSLVMRHTASRLAVSESLSSKAHRPNIEDSTKDTADAMLDTLDILGILRENREISKSELAKRLNTLSIALYDIGLFDDSCIMSQRAVHIFRLLVRAVPGTFESSLAAALNNLSTHLDAATRNAPEHALNLVEEAIGIYRHLVEGGQYVFQSDLAVALINSVTRLGQLKRYQDASRAALDALDILTSLAHDHPHEFKADLVESLVAVSASLRDIRCHKDSLLAAERAVKICRTLAAGSPRQLRSELAASLSAYSRSLSVHNRFEEALEAAEEAVNIRRGLARSRPHTYMRPLALSILDVFELHRRGQNNRKAVQAAKNVADIYRQFISEGSVDFEPDLASLLLATSGCLLDLELPDDALTAITEGIGLYKQLAHAEPDLYQPRYAESLDIAYTCQHRLGRYHEAYNAAQQAIQIWEDLGRKQPEDIYPRLANSVTNAFNSLRSLDRFPDALKFIRYAVKIYRDLEYRPSLAFSLNNLSSCLGKLKFDDEALEAAKEAVDIYRDLHRSTPDATHVQGLAASLFNLSCCFSEPKHHQAALKAAEESVQLYTHLCTTSSTFRSHLSHSQNRLDALRRPGNVKSIRKRA